MGDPLELVLVEDELLLRELLESTLSRVPGLSVMATFGTAEEALSGLEGRRPDMVLCDIDLGSGMDGITLAKELRKRSPELAIAILSNHADLAYVEALRRPLGKSWGYMLKKSALSVESLERCIRSVAAGLVVLDPEIVAAAQPHLAKQQLTARSSELLAYIAQGYSNSAIAEKVALSERSVERLISQIYLDLGIDVGDATANPRVMATLAFLGDQGR